MAILEALPRIEAQIERFAPGFRDCILERRVFSPATLESMNANLIGGDITGGAMMLSQLFARPVARGAPRPLTLPRMDAGERAWLMREALERARHDLAYLGSLTHADHERSDLRFDVDVGRTLRWIDHALAGLEPLEVDPTAEPPASE